MSLICMSCRQPRPAGCLCDAVRPAGQTLPTVDLNTAPPGAGDRGLPTWVFVVAGGTILWGAASALSLYNDWLIANRKRRVRGAR